MRDPDGSDSEHDLSRRTFLRASGLAGGALLGGGTAIGPAGRAVAAAAGESDAYERLYANWRVREAAKVWERGYRGRHDRSLAITDSGVDARHADLSPWNGVRVRDAGDSFELVREDFAFVDGSDVEQTGTIQPGTDGTDLGSIFVGEVEATAAYDPTEPFELSAAVDRFEGSVEWSPAVLGYPNDLGIVLQRRVLEDGEPTWEEVVRKEGILDNPEYFAWDLSAEPGGTYRFVVKTEANATPSDYVASAMGYAAGDEEVIPTGQAVAEAADEGTYEATGTVGPGALNSTTAEEPFSLTTGEYPAGFEVDRYRVEAELAWTPAGNDLEFVLEDDEGNRVARAATADNPETITAVVEPGEYRWIVETYLNDESEYTISATVTAERLEAADTGIEDVVSPSDKVVGWYLSEFPYGQYANPRDDNGHGTHCSSIMAGTGEATVVDPDRTRVDDGSAVLLPGDVLSYEVEAAAGTGVFATVYGQEVDVTIEGPEGHTLATSRLFGYDASIYDSNLVDHSTVHDEGEAPYTVYVTPASYRPTRESSAVADAPAQVEGVCVGAFRPPASGDGDRSGDGVASLNAGLAPDATVVGLNGLSSSQAALSRDPEFFTDYFGVRAVNMSWGTVGGLPLGAVGGEVEEQTIGFGDNPAIQLRKIAEGGILTVAAAGNSFTPANGNSLPAGADDAVSVVATGPLDGVVTFSSGGTGTVDEEGFGGNGDEGDESQYDEKPDVTAPGGQAPIYPASVASPDFYDDIRAAKASDPDSRVDDEPARDSALKGGTSMASPYVCGTASLVAQAMEEDAPASIALPEPDATGFEDVMRLKQVLLATASETVFTAAPYHNAKTIPHPPTYEFGGRDPYEGFGRVNPDAAVDAVTRELPLGGPLRAEVGLDVPADSRAVAGYVSGAGSYEVSVESSHLSGGNAGMARGDPHLDLFVYDAETPAANGEPNVVAKAQALAGSTDLSFSTPESGGTYFVVAKLVNVPGVVNGFDVQVHVDLTVERTADVVATGSRDDGGDVYRSGRTYAPEISVEATDPVLVRDRKPERWEPDAHGNGDVRFEDAEGDFEYVVSEADPGESRSFRYVLRTPEETGAYEFGPVEVSTDGGDTWVAVSGTSDRNYVVDG